MRMPSAIAAASIAIALFAGGFAVGHGVHHSSNSAAPSRGAQVLGQVFPRTQEAATSTTTTTAPTSPQAPPTSQAPVPTTAPKATTKAAPSPTTTAAPAQTTRQVSGACGTGTAEASLQSGTRPRSISPGTDYETDVVVTVDNHINKAIQIDALAIRLVFADGSTLSYSFNQAIGSIVQPGQSTHYGVALRTQNPPTEVQLTAFGFHTAGQAQCPGRAA